MHQEKAMKEVIRKTSQNLKMSYEKASSMEVRPAMPEIVPFIPSTVVGGTP